MISTGGVRSKTGSLDLVTGATPSQGRFKVSGIPNASYSIALYSAPIHLVRYGGVDTMAAHAFVSSPANTGTLDATGTQDINVGASLVVGNTQTAGFYEGTYQVCVEYN